MARIVAQQVRRPRSCRRRSTRRRRIRLQRAKRHPKNVSNEAPVGLLTRKVVRVLRWRRIVSGLKVNQVARATGISATSISRIERERQHVTLDQLQAFADAYEYPINYILERARSEPLE